MQRDVPTLSPPRPLLQAIERLCSPEREFHGTIMFAQYVQYHLHLQLQDASQYAAGKRVALKGDLPIGEGLVDKGIMAIEVCCMDVCWIRSEGSWPGCCGPR